MIKRALKAASGMLYMHSRSGKQALANNALILMLHRVVEEDNYAALPHRNELCVGQASFDRLLVWLKRRFDITELQTLLTTSPTSSRPRVALTFDDGWYDNATLALPVLQRHQVPASIFLSTDFIDSEQGFWWESIGETLWGSFGEQATQQLLTSLSEIGKPVAADLPNLPQNSERSQAIMRYLASLKDQPATVLQALADSCPVGKQPQAMSWQQVSRLEQSGLIRFGAHGASHALLDRLPSAEIHAELQRSLTVVAQRCEQPLPVYCYPNGNHSEAVHQHLQSLNVPYALSTRPGLYRGNSPALALPRIGVSQVTASNPNLLAWRIRQGANA